MKTQLAQVRQFMQSFKQATPEKMAMPDRATHYLRAELIDEEKLELATACDLESYADAVIDSLYVVLGAAVAAGIDGYTLEQMFDEVHTSNMSKLWTAEEVLGIEDQTFTIKCLAFYSDRPYIVKNKHGKVIKSPSYRPANLKQFIPCM